MQNGSAETDSKLGQPSAIEAANKSSGGQNGIVSPKAPADQAEGVNSTQAQGEQKVSGKNYWLF